MTHSDHDDLAVHRSFRSILGTLKVVLEQVQDQCNRQELEKSGHMGHSVEAIKDGLDDDWHRHLVLKLSAEQGRSE